MLTILAKALVNKALGFSDLQLNRVMDTLLLPLGINSRASESVKFGRVPGVFESLSS